MPGFLDDLSIFASRIEPEFFVGNGADFIEKLQRLRRRKIDGDAVEAFGCKVVLVMAILDRHQGGSGEIERRGIPFFKLWESTPEGKVTLSSFPELASDTP